VTVRLDRDIALARENEPRAWVEGFDVRLKATERAGIRFCAMIAVSALSIALASGTAHARWFFEPAPPPATKGGTKSRATLPVQPGFSEPGSARRSSNKNRKTTAVAPKTVEKLPPGPLSIVVSIKKQRLTVYANGQPVAHSPVSTGVPGHPTPQGVFSIIQKNLHHRSNIYSDAPMPYMQRITWSGVAMHEGKLPGYPASHGCIRLPREFAQRLWGMTRIGARVIISQDEVLPSEIVHNRLMALHAPHGTNAAETPAKVRYATAPTPMLDAPLKGAIDDSEAARIEKAIDSAVQAGLAEAESHIQNFAQESVEAVAPGLQGDPDKGRVAGTVKDPVLRPGPISVFVSRKTGKLYVRKGFEDVLETSVTIARPNDAIGTHVFTALKGDDDTLRWNVVSLPTDRLVKSGKYQMTMHRGEKLRKVITPPVHEEVPPGDPRTALDRITIPDATLARLNELMTPGASFIISDLGQSFETGKGTDFIVLTR
jgi:lipoprotein-anchoring transpeptidase ErfK/SrfK